MRNEGLVISLIVSAYMQISVSLTDFKNKGGVGGLISKMSHMEGGETSNAKQRFIFQERKHNCRN